MQIRIFDSENNLLFSGEIYKVTIDYGYTDGSTSDQCIVYQVSRYAVYAPVRQSFPTQPTSNGVFPPLGRSTGEGGAVVNVKLKGRPNKAVPWGGAERSPLTCSVRLRGYFMSNLTTVSRFFTKFFSRSAEHDFHSFPMGVSSVFHAFLERDYEVGYEGCCGASSWD
jgi:hypothetical protein